MGPTLDTVIIGAGQAGLTTSYWLTQFGVEHQLLERHDSLGGAFKDRWDSFYMNTPNLALDLPGMRYDGDDRDSFISRIAVVNLFRRYAELIAAPVHTGVDVTRLSPASDGAFNLETSLGNLRAKNVVLATGAYQVPKIPALSAMLPAGVTQLHTHDYRNPEQLPEGAVLIVGTGQSGGQIAEELHAAGREVHLSVSIVPEAPRRYRGQDLIYWMLETGKHGPEFGVNALTREALPSPAARFAPNPLLSGTDGGHAIHLRELGRRGMHLHGHLESIDDGDLTLSDDLADRLAMVESIFAQRSGKAIDAYISAAGIDAPEQEPPPADGWLPSGPAQLNLTDANITSVIWASGYKLDFSMVDIPLLDEWGYPRHARGVAEPFSSLAPANKAPARGELTVHSEDRSNAEKRGQYKTQRVSPEKQRQRGHHYATSAESGHALFRGIGRHPPPLPVVQGCGKEEHQQQSADDEDHRLRHQPHRHHTRPQDE